jgi:exodeoxyribonuclease V gamma subunit
VPALPLDVVRCALAQALAGPSRGGVPTGAVTFSAMSSLRNLPYKVVCAIGLNDGAFPTAAQPAEFDLMALQPRRGDRQRRIDERNVFLDLLLAAREQLHLSCVGRSVRDNSPLPPSVLVSELLEFLVPAIADAPGDAASRERARARLVVEHPLQAFSASAFQPEGDPRLRSFHREYADALRRRHAAPAAADAPDVAADIDASDDDDDRAVEPAQPFFRAPLAPPGDEWRDVSLERLLQFFRNPCRFLLRQRLGIELARDAGELQDDEPFLPDVPGRSALAARLLPALLAGADVASVRALALAGTELPAGAFGRNLLERELASLQAFATRLRTPTSEPLLAPHSVSIELVAGGKPWRLHADFADLRASGLVRSRYDEPRAADRLAAWLPHLLLCAQPPAGMALRTTWQARDGSFSLRPCEQPLAVLRELLELYERGLREPLYFFAKTAWKYVTSDASLAAANSAWRSTPDRPFGEDADAAIRLALRGRPDPLGAGLGDFRACAHAVFDPLLACLDDPELP